MEPRGTVCQACHRDPESNSTNYCQIVKKDSRMLPAIPGAHCGALTLWVTAYVVKPTDDLIWSLLWYANKAERRTPNDLPKLQADKAQRGIDRV
jgi:hypothetical protein